MDPQHMVRERTKFLADMNRRFTTLQRNVYALVAEDDAFGLDKVTPRELVDLLQNEKRQFEFETLEAKMYAFRMWLKAQIDSGILSTDKGGDPWTDKYIHSAYKKGLIRSYLETNRKQLSVNPNGKDFFEGGQREFLKKAFDGGVATHKIGLVYTRAFSNLRGITADMDAKMSSTFAQGIAEGRGSQYIAKQLVDTVEGINKKRAQVLARTELAYAHSEGQLDSFEEQGVDEVGVMAEWGTAADGYVCPLCEPKEGQVFAVKDAHGLIPFHPNCRCAWLPANVGEHLLKKIKYPDPKTYAAAQVDEAASSQLWGMQPTGVLRWMGKDGWSVAEAKRVLDARGLDISDATIRTQINAGKNGQRGAPAALTGDQINELRGMRDGNTGTTPAPGVPLPPVKVPPQTTTTQAPVVPPPQKKVNKRPDINDYGSTPDKSFEQWRKDTRAYLLEQHGIRMMDKPPIIQNGYKVSKPSEEKQMTGLAMIAKEMEQMANRFEGLAELGANREHKLQVFLDNAALLKKQSGRGSSAYGLHWSYPGGRKDGMAITMARVENQDRQPQKLGNGIWSTSTANGGHDAAATFAHEFGHNVWYYKLNDKERSEWNRQTNAYYSKGSASNGTSSMGKYKLSYDKPRHPLSDYASSNNLELYAEAFAAYTHPEYTRGSLPKEIESLLDKHLKPKPGAHRAAIQTTTTTEDPRVEQQIALALSRLDVIAAREQFRPLSNLELRERFTLEAAIKFMREQRRVFSLPAQVNDGGTTTTSAPIIPVIKTTTTTAMPGSLEDMAAAALANLKKKYKKGGIATDNFFGYREDDPEPYAYLPGMGGQVYKDKEQLVSLPLNKLYATQDVVVKSTVEGLLKKPHLINQVSTDPDQENVQVVYYKGNLYIRDGHHRAVSAKLMGMDRMNVALINLDDKGRLPEGMLPINSPLSTTTTRAPESKKPKQPKQPPKVADVKLHFGSGKDSDKLMESNVQKILGDKPLSTLAEYSGAQSGSDVRVKQKKDQIEIEVLHKDYKAKRILMLKDGRIDHVVNDLFIVNEKQRGKGLGTKVFNDQVQALARDGISEIRTLAGGYKGVKQNGYYTWPRLGYDQSLDKVGAYIPGYDALDGKKVLAQHLGIQLPNFATVEQVNQALAKHNLSDLMKTPQGRALWKEIGYQSRMSFDTREGSTSRKVLDAYVKAKQGR